MLTCIYYHPLSLDLIFDLAGGITWLWQTHSGKGAHTTRCTIPQNVSNVPRFSFGVLTVCQSNRCRYAMMYIDPGFEVRQARNFRKRSMSNWQI
jgi:hypothetical protein